MTSSITPDSSIGSFEPEQNSPDFEISDNVKSLAMIRTRTVVGVHAEPVIVEVHLANGLPSFSTVGLAETAVKESKDRVRGAILNSGFEFPAKRITVNLAPADLPKAGGRLDLPIAIGILIASGQLPNANIGNIELVGELALDGRLRKVSGVLPTALACGKSSRTLIVPSANALEAGLAEHTECMHAAHLLEVCEKLVGENDLPSCEGVEAGDCNASHYPDIQDVKGQPQAKRALEIAAAGGHSLIFVGPPGAGKSMLASRLPGLLPELDNQAALEAAAIQSIAHGEFNIECWKQRPFRSPHHSSSSAALVGGGSIPRPGEISLAHQGILFLDEMTEFSRVALEQLREPLETGEINIARAARSISYPAKFLLIAACNPCKCGYLGDGTDRCRCSAASVEQYRSRLSGPMLDRIDMHIHLPRVDIKTLQSKSIEGESSSSIRARVGEIWHLQMSRQGRLNSQLKANEVERYSRLDNDSMAFLELVCERMNMSARAYHRIIKLARTIADVSGEEQVSKSDVAEAVGYRSLDRQ